jgi:ribosomal protein S18 acetylase RimI-like enzyme
MIAAIDPDYTRFSSAGTVAAVNPPSLILVPATRSHLRQIMPWFPSAHACLVWGGVAFRFPFTDESFAQDCAIDQLPSYALLDASGDLRGFGQCSLRCGRCHLGRLAISPAFRSQGIGTHLVRSLAARGSHHLRTGECSLFVSPSNVRARALYDRLGFRPTAYPDESFDASAYNYMIIKASALSGGSSAGKCGLDP